MSANVENLDNNKTKSPDQVVKEALGKIANRRQAEFTKTIEALVEKRVTAEKAVALVEAEIQAEIAKFKAGL